MTGLCILPAATSGEGAKPVNLKDCFPNYAFLTSATLRLDGIVERRAVKVLAADDEGRYTERHSGHRFQLSGLVYRLSRKLSRRSKDHGMLRQNSLEVTR
jgi:hypothetical protein